MTRPARIDLLGQPFTVRWEERSGVRLHEDDDGYWGVGISVINEQQVVVRTSQGPHQLRDTLLHEILHALIIMTGQSERFRGSGKHPEEPVVAAVATALLAVLRSNPEVVAWLTEPVEQP